MADIKVSNPVCDDDDDDDKGKRGHRGHRGPTGPTGPGTGSTGPTGPSGGGGGGVGLAAEFVQQTQAPNNSRAPGDAYQYETDSPGGVFNSLGIVTATFNGGTAFLLPVGNYLVDHENSVMAASSQGIAKGPAAVGPFTLDVHTIAGSSTGTTWIHGRAIVVAAVPTWIIITPTTGTNAIPTAGNAAGEFIARITILKIA
jgi:hypothetical protein